MMKRVKHRYEYDKNNILVAKSCNKCNLIKPVSEFYMTHRSSQFTCRPCHAQVRQKRSGHEKTIREYNTDDIVIAKECSKCDAVKPIKEFYSGGKITQRCPDGHSTICIICQKLRWHKHAENPEKRKLWLLHRIQSKCRKENLPFDLTIEDLVIPTHCPILGMPLKFGVKTKSKFREGRGGAVPQDSPSVDRIEPELGYVKNNIVIVSYRANLIKTNASVTELIKVADFYKMLVSKKVVKV